MTKRESDYFYFKSFKKQNIYDRPRTLFPNDEASQWMSPVGSELWRCLFDNPKKKGYKKPLQFKKA